MSNQAGLGIGDKVHNEEINEYPADMREEYLRVSEWVRETYQQYGRQVWIKVIDPQSLVGMWKHLRYGVRAYPTFVIEGHTVYRGWEAAGEMVRQIEATLNARRDPAPVGQLPG